MSYPCLAELLEALHDAGQLVRIEPAVEADLEVAAVTQRVATDGPALLFGHVAGRETPVVTNLLASEARICRSLGVGELGELRARLEELFDDGSPHGWLEQLRGYAGGGPLRKFSPRSVRTGPCQQVVRLGRDIDLGRFPFLRSLPGESEPVVTAGLVIAADGKSGRLVIEHHALRVVGRDELAPCWSPHDGLAELFATHRRRRTRMPVAVVLGGDPSLLAVSVAPRPPQVDALGLAGLIAGRPQELVACRTIDLQVPAAAEIVIEGCIEPADGPAGPGRVAVSGGRLVKRAQTPRIHVTAVTHRANPVCPAMVPGDPPDELSVVRQAMGRVFVPLARAVIPEVVDWEFPTCGASGQWVFVSIDQTQPGQAVRVIHAMWGFAALAASRLVVVVDSEVDVRGPLEVWAAVARHLDPARDVWIERGLPGGVVGTADQGGTASRVAIDATGKGPGLSSDGGEAMPEEIIQRVKQRWDQLGLAEPGAKRWGRAS